MFQYLNLWNLQFAVVFLPSTWGYHCQNALLSVQNKLHLCLHFCFLLGSQSFQVQAAVTAASVWDDVMSLSTAGSLASAFLLLGKSSTFGLSWTWLWIVRHGKWSSSFGECKGLVTHCLVEHKSSHGSTWSKPPNWLPHVSTSSW